MLWHGYKYLENMALLGIDYGTKKVGVAYSDEAETIAFPHRVLANTPAIFGTLGRLIAKRHVSGIVIGESKDKGWRDNPVMVQIRHFAHDLGARFSVPIFFEEEFFTTAQARRSSEAHVVDAAAAALILQSYIDKRNGRGKGKEEVGGRVRNKN